MASVAKKKKTVVDLSSLGDGDEAEREIFPTGIPFLDIRLKGGFPAGVLVESYGPQYSAKTSVGYHTIGELQRAGRGSAFLFDVEGSFNESMGLRCGININHLNAQGKKTFEKTSSAEDKIIENVFEKIQTILYHVPDVRFIMVDSLAGLIPQAMVEEGANQNRYDMVKAQVLKIQFAHLARWLADTGNRTVVYFTNHEKDVIEIGGGGGFGPKKTNTPGGKALKFYSGIRLEFRLAKQEKVNTIDPMTNQKTKKMSKMYIRVQATKTRFSEPFNPTTFVFKMTEGIDELSSVLAHAYVQKNIVKKGASYTVPVTITETEQPLEFYGEPKVVKYFKEDPEAYQRLRTAVLADFGEESVEVVVEDEDNDDNFLDLEDLN